MPRRILSQDAVDPPGIVAAAKRRSKAHRQTLVFGCEWQLRKQEAGLPVASSSSCLADRFFPDRQKQKGTMKNIKFVVKVNRGGAHAPQYVLRVDRLPIQTTTDRKLALVMGRFTAEDAVKSMQNSHCNPELVSVRVSA
jgi:hypothetical protein